jgi:hypothetical protein
MLTRTQLRPNGKRSSARRARAHARNFGAPRPDDGDTRDAAVRRMPCILDGRRGHRCTSATRACHARARGAGGAKGDRFDLWPGCDAAHREAGEQPGLGRWEGTLRAMFEARYELSLRTVADDIAQRLTEEGYP